MTQNSVYDIIWFDELPSTNIALKEANRERKLPNRTIYCTHHQFAGKGQMGNQWESEANKNLTFSILLNPEHILIQDQFMISKAVSIGIVKVFSNYNDNFTIKWPNDIYYKDKKIGGILIENTLMANKISESIIGIGLNINQSKFMSNAPNPISLMQITNETYKLTQFLNNILQSIFIELDKISNSINYKAMNSEYIDLLFRNKGYYEFKDKENTFNAKISGISEYGQLMLQKEDGTINTYAFKEVEFVI